LGGQGINLLLYLLYSINITSECSSDTPDKHKDPQPDHPKKETL